MDNSLSLKDFLLRFKTKKPIVYEASAEYWWPLQLMRTLLLLSFFAAGVAKLAAVNFHWASSNNLQNLLISHYYTHSPPTNIGLWLAQYSTLCKILAFGAILLELAAPFGLLRNRFIQVTIVGSLLSMQLGIFLAMGVFFKVYMLCYCFWIPWERLFDTLKARG